MTAPLPTNAALDAAVAELVTRVAPWCRIGDALTAIRRMQDHASLESVGRHVGTPTVTKADNAPVVLRMEDYPHLDRYRHLNHGCHDDGPPEAA